MRNSAAKLAPSLLALAIAASCAPTPDPIIAQPTPLPSPTPTQTPTPTPAATLQPVYENWQDAPSTPGSWTYGTDPSETLAVFESASGSVEMILRCDRTTSSVGLARAGRSENAVPMRVLTETATRLLTAEPVSSSRPLLAAQLPNFDPLLDAMAFSKGRFAVEVAGLPTLYLPAQPVVSRIIEDCR